MPGKAQMHRGRLVATALAGAWRRSPPPLSFSRGELAEVTPLLLGTGAGSLGWRRVLRSDLRTSPTAFELQEAYRLHTLQAAVHEGGITQAVTHLRSSGVDPLLGKGWAVARLYPEPGLRPYGDIDICVRPEEHSAAVAALASPAAQGCAVDLHQRFFGLDDRTLDELYARSRVERLGEVDVRILGPEDHLRLLCVHMLSHGAWRPLWLCDIGAALESRPADFDWDLCLTGSKRRADWVACALGLAHKVLSARLDGTPVAWRANHLPSWLIPTVLRQWGAGYRHRDPIVTYLRNPAGALEALRLCWPNPILATVEVGGPFNELPRLPFQIGQCLRRTAQIAAELAGSLRRQGEAFRPERP